MHIKTKNNFIYVFRTGNAEKVLKYLSSMKETVKWHDYYLAETESSPISYAAALGMTEVLKRFHDHGFSLDGNSYNSPFISAIINNKFNTAMYVLDTGSNISQPRNLTVAIQYGSIRIVTHMLNSGADAQNAEAFKAAIENNDQDVYTLLIAHGGKPENTKEFDSLLCRALERNKDSIVQDLIKRSHDHQCPLAMKYLAQNAKLFHYYTMMLEHGAQPHDLSYEEDATLLHIAAQDGNTLVVHHLLHNAAIAADIAANAVTDKGQTALHFAVKGNSSSTVEALLKAGGDPSIADHAGALPLHLAYAQKTLSPEIEKLLLHADTPAAKAQRANTPWKKLDGEKIAHIESFPEIGKAITHIFNFTDHERTTIVDDMEIGGKSAVTISPFDQVPASVLSAAFNAYRDRNGTLNEQEALHGRPAKLLFSKQDGPQP